MEAHVPIDAKEQSRLDAHVKQCDLQAHVEGMFADRNLDELARNTLTNTIFLLIGTLAKASASASPASSSSSGHHQQRPSLLAAVMSDTAVSAIAADAAIRNLTARCDE